MRFLHNNIGFFMVGLIVIYSLSGIVLTYRDTDFLKQEILNEKQLSPNLTASKLGSALRLRIFKVEKEEGDVIYFNEGTYNQKTGMASYTTREFYAWMNPFLDLHKTANGLARFFTAILGALLLFMAISAFWMFKSGTTLFSRGVFMTVAGIVMAIILLIL